MLTGAVFIMFCFIAVGGDRERISWKSFLIFGLPLLALFYYFYSAGDSLWWKMARWMFQNVPHPINLDPYMNYIPLNTGGWARWYTSPLLDKLMIWVYIHGFTLSLWLCIMRSFFAKSIKKMLTYALSGHLLQFPLILPFYNLLLVHEVWFVNKQPDLLQRHLSGNELLVHVMNSFPSMHTSIAFAMLLIASRERNRLFKYAMIMYCSAIIYSTLYLQIHWLVDVIAGMMFAYGTVKLADWLIKQAVAKWIPYYCPSVSCIIFQSPDHTTK